MIKHTLSWGACAQIFSQLKPNVQQMSRNGKTSTYGWGAPLPICRSEIAPGGYSRKFYTGRLPLGDEPPTLVIYHLLTEKVPHSFLIPFIDKWPHPLRKFSLELCIPFNYCKRTFFLNGLKNRIKVKKTTATTDQTTSKRLRYTIFRLASNRCWWTWWGVVLTSSKTLRSLKKRHFLCARMFEAERPR